MDDKNYKNIQNTKKIDDTKKKIEKMKDILSDKDKCKEIAHKLCDYISKNS